MEEKAIYPQVHPNSVLEGVSEKYFENCLPRGWQSEKPKDFGIDRIVTPMINGQIPGLHFFVQLKATGDAKGKLEVRLKRTTLNYLFNRLEPGMVVLMMMPNKRPGGSGCSR